MTYLGRRFLLEVEETTTSQQTKGAK